MDILTIYMQSQTHKIINIDLKEQMLSHAYLLECADSYILDNYALFIAKEIFCLEKDSAPCGKCLNCQKLEHGNLVDLSIYPKEKSSLVVDDIKNIVFDAQIKPIENENKVYILKNFEEANVQTQNKLLKTLEEPPQNVVFIITCKSLEPVLPTIRSRAKTICENTLNSDTVSQFLVDLKVLDIDDIVAISDGKIDYAMALSNSSAKHIVDLAISTLTLRSSSDVVRFSSQILALKKDFKYFVNTLILLLRDMSVYGFSKLKFSHRESDIKRLSEMYTKDAISKITYNLCEIFNKLDFNCNLTAVVDQMLLNILEVRFLCQK